tara:strand:+ start:626 stop:1195 length:570 start_codon:yes stop_codon:yes gene_type:complete
MTRSVISTAASNITGTLSSTQMPAGNVLQVISNVMDGDSYIASSSHVHLTDLTTTITPRSATSKIFCTMQISISAVTRYHNTKLYRSIGGGSDVQIAYGDPGSNTSNPPCWMVLGTGQGTNKEYEQRTISGTFLDSPNTTSAIVYKPHIGVYSAANTYAINTSHYNSGNYNEVWNNAPITTFTVMEIAG